MYVYGWLKTKSGGSVDNALPEGPGGEIDNSLPGGPVHIGGGPLPPPLPGVWPPLNPGHPVQPLPPDLPWKPGMIWPGAHPVDPGWGVRPPHGSTMPLPPDASIDNELPGEGEEQPPNAKPEKFVVLCWISGGIGWNYVVVDTSLKPQPK